MELGVEEGVLGDGLLHLGFEQSDLAGEQTQAGLELAKNEGMKVGEAGLDLKGAVFEDGLLACDDERLEGELGGCRHRVGFGLSGLAKELEVLGIEGIGFGLLALALDEMANLGGIGDGDRPALLLSGADQSAVIRTGGLTNQMGARRQPGEKAGETGPVIGQDPALLWGEEKVEFKFGEVEADGGGREGHEG